jgi:putative transposase
MPRRLRLDEGGIVYHVLNRRVGRQAIFKHEEDYAAFEQVLEDAGQRRPMRMLAYCLMPNHWHLVLWPRKDGDLARYMQWLTTTHIRRWHAHHGTRGQGPLYQGRYHSFPVQEDLHFLVVCRYVERNPLRACLVARAQEWRWSSLGRPRGRGRDWLSPRSEWPVEVPRNWTVLVNRPQTDAEEAAVRRSVRRGAPFGEGAWQQRTARRLKLECSLRNPWRPRKEPEEEKK